MTLQKIAKIAFKNIFRNKRRSAITICIGGAGYAALAIAAGYISFTFFGLTAMTICTGFTGSGGGGHMQIIPAEALENEAAYPLEFGIRDYRNIVTEILKIPAVRLSMPRININGLISNGEKTVAFLGKGVDAYCEGMLLQPFVDDNRIQLDNSAYYFLQKDPRGVILGQTMARSLNVKAGEELVLITNTSDNAINAVDVVVKGTFSTGSKKADRYCLMMNIGLAQELLQTGKAEKLVVAMRRQYTPETPHYAAMIQNLLTQKFPQERLTVRQWDEIADYYHAIRAIYYIIFGFMGSIIFIIVVLSCVNTSLMASMERISEIGTLRSIGVSMRWITTMFLLEGGFIGLASVLLGIVFQLVVTFLTNSIGFMMPPPPGMDLPYKLQVFYITPALPFVALLIILSTILSSGFTMWRVKKITITEALNHV